MIALDTNILVRLLVADDAKQTKQVRGFFDRLTADDEVAHVPDIVLCELVWVLQSCYQLTRSQIAGALNRLRAAKQLRFERPDLLAAALRAYQAGGGDLADYLIREHARVAGCTAVVTFDKKLLREDLFQSP